MQISSLRPFVNYVNFCGQMVNAVYFNDSHANTRNIDSFLNARDNFYCKNSSNVNLTLCGGDLFLDKSIANKIVASKLRNSVDAYAVGNHDIESGNILADNIRKNYSFGKWLAANLTFSKPTPLSDSIMKSLIIEKKGERIGVIGVAPFDLEEVMFSTPENSFIHAESLNRTIRRVRVEVGKLEKSKIDKIILIAHTGEKMPDGTNIYGELAKIGGIDAILGWHDHREVDRWETTERGEPVRIVATGKSDSNQFKGNLNMFGILQMYFDDNGILEPQKCKNKFKETSKYKSSVDESGMPILTKLKSPVICDTPLREENKVANIVADSNLWYVNSKTTGEKADFAFVNSGTIRSNFDTPSITEENVAEVVPFTTQTLIKTRLTKKQIIEALTTSAKSCKNTKASPGLMQVSGLRYNVDKDFNVSDVRIVDKKGKIKCRLDNIPETREFNCVYDTFLATGPEGLESLKKDLSKDDVETFPEATRQKALYDYFKENKTQYDYTMKRIFFID